MSRPSKSYSAARRPLAAAARAMIEQLELRSLYTAAPVDVTTPLANVDQGEIVQADFTAGNAVTGWTVNWGDGTRGHFASTRSHATHQYANPGTYAATFYAATPGPDAAPGTVTYTVQNVAPEVAITDVPAAGFEGTAIGVSSIVNDASPASGRVYGWTVYRDGKHFIVPDNTDISSDHFTFTPSDNGTYVIRLTVLDGQGAYTTVRTTPIIVANVAPTGSIGGVPSAAVDGSQAVVLSANATDAGSDDTLTYAWSLSRNGNPIDLADPAARNQTLASLEDGFYTAGCIVTDSDGASTVLTPATFEVRAALPTTSVSIAGLPLSSDEGAALNAYATVFGPGAGNVQSFAWSVTKDGQSYALPGDVDTASNSFSFTPSDHGEYVVSLSVSDGTSLIGSASQAITVADVAPAVTVHGEPGTIDEGTSVHLTTTLTDPGVGDSHVFAWTIKKDGQPWLPPAGTQLDSNDLTFTPPDNGTYVATVTVQDSGGGESSSDSSPIIVRNVAPAVIITGEPTSADEGSTITLGSMVSDPGTTDTHAYAWSITKDGRPYALASVVDVSSSTFSFQPNDNGAYVATLEVTDNDGGATIAHSQIIAVANVAPVGNISSVVAANEGDTISLMAYGTDAGLADTLTYSWRVSRDGQTVSAHAGSSAELDYTPVLPGDYVFTATISDGDGGVTEVARAVAVANVPPFIAITGPAANAGLGETLSYASVVIDPGQETLTYGWSVKRDGLDVALPSDVATNGSSLTFIASDAGNYVATLTVNDGVGGVTTASSDTTSVIALTA